MSAPKKDDQVEDVVVDVAVYNAWLFDMDGVLTNTASVHAGAWKQAFDEFLKTEATSAGKTYAPFDAEGDYEKYVDGEPRDDGVRNFLTARGITLSEGADDDPSDARTIKGVGKRKNELFLEALKNEGVKVFDGAVALVKELRLKGAKVAVVSASENTRTALVAAGIIDLFDAVVDGHVVKDLDLKGKPAPDSYLQGAKVLGVDADSAVVLEDALAGVEAGRAGRFGLVVGVDHHDAPGVRDYADELRAHGADVVVTSLAELMTHGSPTVSDNPQ
jgi:beta-phosphoglucomutase family hydrolase